MQQTHKRQWKAPDSLPEDKPIIPEKSAMETFGNQKPTTFADNNKDYNSNKMTVPDRGNSNNSSLSPKGVDLGSKPTFGSKKDKKKDVTKNPFAKMGPAVSKQSSAAAQPPNDPPAQTSFTNFEGNNSRFGTGGNNAKETTMFSNNDSKVSSQPSNFDSKIKPVALNETGPLNFSGMNNKNGKSDSGSGIAEQISDNYDDDDFEVSYAQGSKVHDPFKNNQ